MASKTSLSQRALWAVGEPIANLLADSLLNPGDIVICGAPSYFVISGALGSLGDRMIGVEMDADRIVPEALEQELARAIRGVV